MTTSEGNTQAESKTRPPNNTANELHNSIGNT